MTWWLQQLNSEGLSQGDVVTPLPLGVSVVQPVPLKAASGKHGRRIWEPVDSETGHFLFAGKTQHVLVLSHHCELDKQQRKRRVVVAPIAPIAQIADENARRSVLAQERISKLPLPEIPQLGTCYADLTLMASTTSELLPEEGRLVSMTEDGITRLRVQLTRFFTRLDEQVLTLALAGRP